MGSELPDSLARYLSVGIALGVGLIALHPVYGQTGQAKAELQIRVTGAVSAPVRVFCTSSAGAGNYGATVTVVCATGAVVGIAGPDSFRSVNGGAYRYLLQVKNGEQTVEEIDAQTSTGTITGWKVVKLANQEYVELTLGW
jgi:hypothetical protein